MLQTWSPQTPPIDPIDLVRKEVMAGKWLLVAGIFHALLVGAQGSLIAELVQSLFDSVQFGTIATTSTGSPAFPTDFFRWQILLGALSLASYVYIGVRIWWTYRVCSTGKRIGNRQQYDPVLTAASFIIPVIQYWFPYIGIRDCVRPDQRQPLLGWWWASSLLHQLVAVIAGALLGYFVGWWLAFPIATSIGLGHAYLERRITLATLAAHQSSFDAGLATV
jgi:hypothetical protein